jgi:hypothetical protein
VDAQVLESRIRHGGHAGRRQRADAQLHDVAVAHDGHDVCGDFLLHGVGHNGFFVHLRPLVSFAVHFHPVVDVVDGNRVEAAAFRPGIVGAHFEDDFLGGLFEDLAAVGPVGHVEVAVVVRRGGRVEPPVDAALLPVAMGKPVVVGPDAARPAPGRPAGCAVFFPRLAVPGEEEMLVHAVEALTRIDLLQLRMGVKIAGQPKLDVAEVAGSRPQPLGDRFRTDGGIAADGSVVDPVARPDHVGDLPGGSFLVAYFLLNRCCHTSLSSLCLSPRSVPKILLHINNIPTLQDITSVW